METEQKNIPCLPCALHEEALPILKTNPGPSRALQILPADRPAFMNSYHVFGGNLGMCRSNEFISYKMVSPVKARQPSRSRSFVPALSALVFRLGGTQTRHPHIGTAQMRGQNPWLGQPAGAPR